MLHDTQYKKSGFRISEIEHRYGDNVHILADPFLFTILARFCHPGCKQPTVNALLQTLYRELVKAVVNNEFPRSETNLVTRMHAMHPEGEFSAPVVDPNTKVVAVNLARAGTVPSQICFDAFNHLLNPEGVRQDHISINRKVDSSERVVGTNLGGVKIGGSISDAYVVFPDPMGATGSTILTAMDIYRDEVQGKASKFIAIHLVITPEYLSAVTQRFAGLSIYSIRLDRGLSSKEVLDTIPGTRWKEERGLNEKHYIVPGAGGVGEILNNSYV